MDPMGPDRDGDGPSRRYGSFNAGDDDSFVVYDTTNCDAWIESTETVAIRE